MFDHLVILTLEPFKPAIFSIMERFCQGVRYQFVFNKEELQNVLPEVTGRSLLISFGNGVIVDELTLTQFGAAYNFHPASPEYPGLHPHHFAALNEEITYGAVCHKMTKDVDKGEIVLCQRFSVPEMSPWMAYLNLALDETFVLMEKLFEMIFIKKELPQPCGAEWGQKNYTRKDLYQAGSVPLDASKNDLERLWRSLQVDNPEPILYLDLHGYRFRFEKVIQEGEAAIVPSEIQAQLI